MEVMEVFLNQDAALLAEVDGQFCWSSASAFCAYPQLSLYVRGGDLAPFWHDFLRPKTPGNAPISLRCPHALAKRVHELGILRWRTSNHRHQDKSVRCSSAVFDHLGSARP